MAKNNTGRAVRGIALFLAMIMLLGGLASCGNKKLESTEEESAVVMTVGGYEVPYELYRYLVLQSRKLMHGADADEIREAVFQSLRDIYAVFSLCEDYGVDPNGEYIEEQTKRAVEALQAEYDNTADYADALAAEFMNHSVYSFLQKQSAASDELYYAMEEAGDIPSDETYLRELINSDAFICVKQILVVGEQSISYSDGSYFRPAETHTDEEAAAIAEKARARAAAGENFDALVAEYGESLYMISNTDGYYLCHGMWDDINEQAAFALEVGEISPVIASDRGFSVFQRVEKDAKYIEKNFDSICEDYFSALFMLALEERSASLAIKTNELFDSYSIDEME